MTPDLALVKALQVYFSSQHPDSLLWDSSDQQYPREMSARVLSHSQSPYLDITEDKSGCSTYTESLTQPLSPQGFLIYNPHKSSIYLLKVDKGWFQDEKHSLRCDCVVFDSQTLCFIELKLNVKTWKRAPKRIKEAVEQIKATLTFFKLNMMNCYLSQFKQLEAYVVMKTNVYPKKSASSDIRQVKFLEETGIKLYEGNDKSF